MAQVLAEELKRDKFTTVLQARLDSTNCFRTSALRADLRPRGRRR
jgi:hypothetical protein